MCVQPSSIKNTVLDVSFPKAFKSTSLQKITILVINPRCACTARVTVLGLSVRLSVCYHVFFHHAQQTGKKTTPTGSALHWLHFLMTIFVKVPFSEVMA